jgi:hypothetical protein
MVPSEFKTKSLSKWKGNEQSCTFKSAHSVGAVIQVSAAVCGSQPTPGNGVMLKGGIDGLKTGMSKMGRGKGGSKRPNACASSSSNAIGWREGAERRGKAGSKLLMAIVGANLDSVEWGK